MRRRAARSRHGPSAARVRLLGDQDEEVPIATADFAARVLTQARSVHIVHLPNTKHFIPWVQPDRVKAQILEHVNAAQR